MRYDVATTSDDGRRLRAGRPVHQNTYIVYNEERGDEHDRAIKFTSGLLDHVECTPICRPDQLTWASCVDLEQKDRGVGMSIGVVCLRVPRSLEHIFFHAIRYFSRENIIEHLNIVGQSGSVTR